MSTHNFLTRLEDAKQNGLWHFKSGNTVPSAVAGYAIGCIFQHLDGGAHVVGLDLTKGGEIRFGVIDCQQRIGHGNSWCVDHEIPFSLLGGRLSKR